MREDAARRAVAVVGIGATLPDAPDVKTFWENLKQGVYSISEVPPDRWDPRIHFDPDPKAPEKSYSKIGGWVKTSAWDPIAWHLPIPPKVVDSLDRTQKWSIACVREALHDYGYPKKPLDGARTAVILGNAMAGDKHYLTAMRVYFSEFADDLLRSPAFSSLPADTRDSILREAHSSLNQRLPEINEDTMPGELANVIAGRIAALFDLHGPNYTCDAACASAMAAMTAAIEGLDEGDFDAVLTGGIDANMSASSFVKFCKIGALSATGTRPYADGADGFVMGEGAAVFLLKRLEDAERDGDRIHAVIRGIGGASDGKGKGITAPNPVGQKLALERAYRSAGVSPATVTMLEGHGTSTKVGDVVEAQGMIEMLASYGLPKGQIALGSVKSNIGHLKGAAGAAGMLKAVLCLRERQLVPSLGFTRANPNIDFEHSPLRVNTELRPWATTVDGIRRAGVSAFGFGGTNFHAVLEEYVPGRIAAERQKISQVKNQVLNVTSSISAQSPTLGTNPPLRGALVLGAENLEGLKEALSRVTQEAQAGHAPQPTRPNVSSLRASVRLAIDYGDAADLAQKAAKAMSALGQSNPGTWKALRAQGIFLGKGKPSKLAFLFTGQGSQYVNMLRDLRQASKVVAETFEEADRVMTPLLGEPLSELIFVDSNDAGQVARTETLLRQTAITQPAVLATDIALFRLLGTYGIAPDLVMGHSLGEYGALVAAGSMAFGDALRAVSARGTEMTRVSMADNGAMIAVFGPLTEIERILKAISGYVVVANINSKKQAVVGGATDAVKQAAAAFEQAGMRVVPLPVSHAFHTAIVAPASEPLKRVLATLNLKAPTIPLVSNVTGDFYPSGPDTVPEMIELLGRQIASPVQFVKGLETCFKAGARAFVETGPKKTLASFAEEVLGESDEDLIALSTNHPKTGDIASFNQALCALYAAGYGALESAQISVPKEAPQAIVETKAAKASITPQASPRSLSAMGEDRYQELGRLFAEMMERGLRIAGVSGGGGNNEGIVITGAGMGLPGGTKVFDDENIPRLLEGEQRIDSIPIKLRDTIVGRHVTRLVKSDQGGGPRFESIESTHDVIKLAGRAGAFDLVDEFGVPQDRMPALDTTTKLAFGAGLEALRDAGIPLCMHYKTTTKGTKLPDRWMLPDELRDDTGVIFGSAFPGYDALAADMEHFYSDHNRRERIGDLRSLRGRLEGHTSPELLEEVDRRIASLEHQLERDPYHLDRKYLFKILSMGHSQFAEYIGARGPNTQINAACASGTQAVALAQDWIRMGRCKRVVVVTSDNVTSDALMGWIGAGFLASGAAATDEVVAEAALPFDRRRHGMVLGMGAAALVVESAEAAQERGLLPICEVLSTMTANSAFHGSRLDADHISQVMEHLVSKAEKQHGLSREAIARELVFVSHETYTPARGGSAQAEVIALRRVFGKAAEQIVIANTKGFTGHAMGAGIEDVVAVKMLETGIVPPVANFKEVDPELGWLNLSRGGIYPIRYALRLGAGFGSQICMSLSRRTDTPGRAHTPMHALGYNYRVADKGLFDAWLSRLSGQSSPELEVVKRTLRIKDRMMGDKTAPKAEAKPTPRVEKAEAPSTKTEQVQPKAASLAPAAPKPAPAAPPPPPPQAPVKSADDEIRTRVIEIVSKQTGYPPDMLDVELDLEADLGVDTVKQAETFAAVREAYQIPRETNLKLKDFPTLAHVIRWVKEKRPDLVPLAPAPAAPPPAAAAPAPAAPAPAVQASGDEEIRQKVIEIVAKQTGYPPDMLDVELDLEADLGVDTVKQAETFAAVREAYQIPRETNLKLKDFPTLAHVIRWVKEKRPDLVSLAPAPAAPAAAPAPAAPAPAAQASGDEEIRQKVIEIVAKQTGYPPDMLDVELDLEADLGVDTVKQAETFAAVREAYQIPRETNLKLKDFPTLAHVIRWVKEKRPDLVSLAPAPAAPAPVPAPAAPVPAVQASGDEEIRQKVIEIVAKQTGYPPDMLDVELDLEADLGVDTVKQAETFAAVREAYQIPRETNLKLKDFPTLAHVIRWVKEKRPDIGGSGAAQHAPPPKQEEQAKTEARPELKLMQGDAEAAARVLRRVPTAVLRPSLDACKPTGIELASDARVAVITDEGGCGKALCARLSALGVNVLELSPAEGEARVLEQLNQWSSQGKVSGIYWLPALDPEGDWAQLSLEQWRSGLSRRVKLLHRVSQALYSHFVSGAFAISATRLGGRHGYTPEGATNPMGGSVCGFTKSLKRERPDALIKVVDVNGSASTEAVAELLIAETLRDPGAVEIGYADGQRWTVASIEQPLAEHGSGLKLGQDSVVLVTGAAGSIVSAITADLAKQGGSFYLLDLAPEPDANDPDILRFGSDREGLKHDLMERAKAKGEKVTPVMIERQLAQLERAWSTVAARAAISEAGGTSFYRRVDLRDGAQVSSVIDEIRARHGKVDLLLHAAGLEISRFLPDKKAEEFDLVFDVKSDGWFHLWHGLKDMPLGATVGFGSIAGRFGNGGQTDYSAANDLLAKAASYARNARPDTQCVVLDWTAWGGIGMASRGSIPKMMEVAGIDMLPGQAGIPIIGRELRAGFRGEVVIAGRLGILSKEWDETGGLDTALLMSRPGGPISGRIAAMTLARGLCVETELHPEKQAFLFDHRIDGTAVLPGVMGLEAFVEAVHLMLPDWHIQGVEDVSFLAPFKFYRGEARQIRVLAQIQSEGQYLAAHCQLLGSRTLAGQSEPQITTHFTATVRLSRDSAAAPQAGQAPTSTSAVTVTKDAIYRVYFHGPAYQVLQDAWKEDAEIIGRLDAPLPPSHTPSSPPTLFSPRLIELFFQTAGIWEIGTTGRLALPAQIQKVRVFGSGEDAPASCFARIHPQPDGSFSGTVIGSDGQILAEVEGYRTVELGPVDEERRQPLARAME